MVEKGVGMKQRKSFFGIVLWRRYKPPQEQVVLSFADFLRTRERIDEVRLPHYLRWIQTYLNWMNRTKPDQRSLAEFVHYLSDKYPDWQIAQARHTVQLYSYYRSLDGQQEGAPLPPSQFQREGGWDKVPDAISRLMRMKHMSLRTERAYLAWVRQFEAFVKGKACELVTEEDIRNFLSHLAVDRHVAAATQKVAFSALLFLSGTSCESRFTASHPSFHPGFRAGSLSSSAGRRSDESSITWRGRIVSWPPSSTGPASASKSAFPCGSRISTSTGVA